MNAIPAKDRQKAEDLRLRFPIGMRDRIKAASAASGRSMNAEIVHRLGLSMHEKVGSAEAATSPSPGHPTASYQNTQDIADDTADSAAGASARREQALLDLELGIEEAARFGELADFVAEAMIAGPQRGDALVHLNAWQRDLLSFAVLQARIATDRSRAAFHAAARERS